MSTIGVTPDLPLYVSTTKRILAELGGFLLELKENWKVSRDDYGRIEAISPYWEAEFKDGSATVLYPETEAAAPTPSVFNPASAAKRDTQELINKYYDNLKQSVDIEYHVIKNEVGEVEAILPRRIFKFKTNEEVAADLAKTVQKDVINAK